jgi:hypothetical protein
MFDYANNRKFYSADEEFLSGGAVYSGYVLRDGENFTDLDGNTLTKESTFSTDLAASGFFRDRIVSDTLSIPNPLSAIQIKVNDIVTDRLINDKFNLLHENSIYIYKSLQVPNNYLPTSNDVRYAALSSPSEFRWYNSYGTQLEYGDTAYPTFNDINHGFGVTSNADSSKFSLFCTTSSSFISLTGSQDTLGVVESSPYIEQTDNQHVFINITSMDYDNGIIFICDKGANTVYKYDITSYLNGDTGIYNKRVLIESVGTKGNTQDKSRFNAPSIVAVKSDRVAIYDSGNRTIKIFDNDFNFITTLATGNFRREPAVAMRYNRFTDELYVITITSSRSLRLYRVQSDLSVDPAIDLVETLSANEEVKEISFSPNDSNYWYLTTTGYIYKKLVNNPANTIGAYDNGNLFLLYTYIWNFAAIIWQNANITWNSTTNRSSANGNFIGITLEESDSNYDTVFMFKYGRFYRYGEPNNYINVLDYYNAENYSISNISLSTEEFLQPVVYNKEIYKLIYNLLNLKNNIIGKYRGSYDDSGVYRLLGYDYTIDLSNFNIDNINNFIIHQNEGINYYTINRTLSRICQLQQVLLDAVVIEIKGLIPHPFTRNTLIVD